MIKLIYIAGLWDGYDHIAGKGFIQSIVTFSIGLTILIFTKSLRSAHSMPVR